MQIDRAGSHPLSFAHVAVTLGQVGKGLDAGQQPDKAQDKALQAAHEAPANPPVLEKSASLESQRSKFWPASQCTTVVTEE